MSIENKLNVLLIDDNPEFCFESSFAKILEEQDEDIEDIVFNQEDDEEYKKYFNLHWIQTPSEARWILNACDNNIEIQRGIFELGLPAEILIFDYDLSGAGNNCPKDSEQASNIQHKIKTVLNIDIPLSEEFKNVPNNTFGCYIGGVFAKTFYHYPCGVIPTTARHKNMDSNADTGFFEWFNQDYIDFSERTNQTPNWKELINRGIKAFRERVVKLINAQLITIPPQQLLDLITNPIQAKESFISIYSNVGCRHLPVQGIFIDVLLADNSKYEDAATKWADALLKGIFKNHNQDDFFEAKFISKIYFDSYFSAQKEIRKELSSLIAELELSDSTIDDSNDKKRLLELCNIVGIRLNNNENPKGIKINDSAWYLPVWNQYNKMSSTVARLVVFLLMIKMEKYLKEKYQKSISVKNILELLDPLPEKVLINEKRTKAFKALERLKISIKNVLKGLPEEGLIAGESRLLKLYAHEIDFDENDWPAWLKNAP